MGDAIYELEKPGIMFQKQKLLRYEKGYIPQEFYGLE